MHTHNPSYSDLKAPAPANANAATKAPGAASIHYAGAKDPRIPKPYVFGGLVVLAGIAYALRGFVHF